MPRRYITLKWNGRTVKRRVLTKEEDRERVRKMLATRTARRAATVAGTESVRREPKERKKKPTNGDAQTPQQMLVELEDLRSRVHKALVWLGTVRGFLKEKFGRDAIDAADSGHKAAMVAEDLLRKR